MHKAKLIEREPQPRYPRRPLVLSLFPGADLLGMAFEAEGFAVVRGPDMLMGGMVQAFEGIAGAFDGIIGGPPCQMFSEACKGQQALGQNLIPEFERIVGESEPAWWVMEEVYHAPRPFDWEDEYQFADLVTDAWKFGASQHRTRRFTSSITNLGLRLQRYLLPANKRHPDPLPTVTATEDRYSSNARPEFGARRAGHKIGRRMSLAEVNAAMGLDPEWATPALLLRRAYAVRGNGVPIPMGRAIAKAVRDEVATPTQRTYMALSGRNFRRHHHLPDEVAWQGNTQPDTGLFHDETEATSELL